MDRAVKISFLCLCGVIAMALASGILAFAIQ